MRSNELPADIDLADAAIYKSSLRDVVKGWVDDIPTYSNQPGTEKAYDEMGAIVLARMQDMGGVPTTLDKDTARYGFSLIPRLMYAGAVTAKTADYSMEGFLDHFNQPGSFNSLHRITREVDPAAFEIEFENGLSTHLHSSIDFHLGKYKLSSDGLAMPLYAVDRLRARDRVKEGDLGLPDGMKTFPDKIDDDPIRCPAGRTNGIIALGYRGVMKICILDPNLFAATLSTESPS